MHFKIFLTRLIIVILMFFYFRYSGLLHALTLKRFSIMTAIFCVAYVSIWLIFEETSLYHLAENYFSSFVYITFTFDAFMCLLALPLTAYFLKTAQIYSYNNLCLTTFYLIVLGEVAVIAFAIIMFVIYVSLGMRL